MPTNPTDPAPDSAVDLTGDSGAYEVPEELGATVLDEGGSETPPAPRSGALRIALVVAAVLLVGAGLLAYRAQHRRKVLRDGLARADVLLRLDTAAGYRDAASLLDPLAQLDPMEAASVRAFALAMLFADYRASDLEADAEGLLVGPGRADAVPTYASLASAALALGRGEAGSATTSVARAGDGAWARTLQARVAILAGNVPAALEPAASAASEGAFPPGLALHGDVLRRLRKDPAAARAAYEAALSASPLQPRAAYGLAKLALAGQAPPEGAIAALERLVADRDATPGPERGRAALHLAALRLRAGDRAGADAALDAAGLEGGPARAWAARAAEVEAESRGPYRAVSGAVPGLQSASDDDPPVLSPDPRPPPPPKAAAKPAPKKGSKVAAKPASKKATATAKKATSKKPATKKTTTKKATKSTAR